MSNMTVRNNPAVRNTGAPQPRPAVPLTATTTSAAGNEHPIPVAEQPADALTTTPIASDLSAAGDRAPNLGAETTRNNGVLNMLGRTAATGGESGSLDHPIVDSKMSRDEALRNVAPECPADILQNQQLLEVKYYGVDGKVHQGQLVVDRRLADDLRQVFDFALQHKFPIEGVVPIAEPKFARDGRWDDETSMQYNNSSAFNYRKATGSRKLSKHALGFAIDINPRINPYVKGTYVAPANGSYDPSVPGTLTKDHPLVQKFKQLGWTWGGDWTSSKDWQHFEKVPPGADQYAAVQVDRFDRMFA